MAQVIQFSGAGAQSPAASIRRRDVGSVRPSATIFHFPIKRAKPDAEREELGDNMRKWLERRDRQARFGKRLRVARAILGLSIEAAAIAANVKPISFKHYESGVSEMRTARFMAFVNHPTVTLCGFLLAWLLEDGAPSDKEREIIRHCRSVGAQISLEAVGAINYLDIEARR